MGRLRNILATPAGVLMAFGLASLGCGLWINPHAYVWLAATMTTLVIGVTWPWLSIAGVSVQLRPRQCRVTEGQPVETELIIYNRWLWPVVGLHVRGLGDSVPVRVAPSRGELRQVIAVPTSRRGAWPVSQIVVECSFPLGLWRASKPLVIDQAVLVWPRLAAAPPVPAPSGRVSFDGVLSQNGADSGGDFAGVRPYRRGDPLRRIHWTQTARHDRLITTKHCSLSRPAITVVLDDRKSAHGGDGLDQTFDQAIRLAAGLYAAWSRDGVAVTLHCGCKLLARPGTPTHHMLDRLAVAEAENTEPSIAISNGDIIITTRGHDVVMQGSGHAN